MHGELTGSGMGFIETTAPRPVSGRKVVGRPTESRIFSQEALPVRRVSPRKQAALQGILGFTEAPKECVPPMCMVLTFASSCLRHGTCRTACVVTQAVQYIGQLTYGSRHTTMQRQLAPV